MKEKIKMYIRKFIKEKPKHSAGIGFVLAVAFCVAVYSYFVSAVLPPFNFYTVTKSDITETVTAQGVVKPSASIDLAFPKSALIAGVYAKEGDTVSRGGVLATLANADLHSSLSQAEANLLAENAKLSTMESGDRPEDLMAKQTSVSTTKNILLNSIHTAYTVSDDVIHTQTLALFSDMRGANPSLTFSFPDFAMKISIEEKRKELEKTLSDWSISLSQMNETSDPISGGYSDTTIKNLRSVASYLDTLAGALAIATPDSVNTSAVLAQYRASVSLARTNVNNATSALSGSAQSEANAESALALAKAGSTPGDIEAENARVLQAQASVDSVKVSIAQTSLVSPIDGIVTRMDAKVGAVASANVLLASVISQGQYQIDAYISQIDIGKIKLGQKANVTLDSEGTGNNFPATVVYIGNGNVPVGGAASYKVTLQFDIVNNHIKQGMNANISIFAESKIGVLSVPKSSVLFQNGESYVQVETDKGLEKRKIETGITGDTGLVEVISGLSEGEKVVNFGS